MHCEHGGHTHTFEREAITRWLSLHMRCPIDNSYVYSKDLEPDNVLQCNIDTYVRDRPSLALQQAQRNDDFNLHVLLWANYRKDERETRAQWEELVLAERTNEAHSLGNRPFFLHVGASVSLATQRRSSDNVPEEFKCPITQDIMFEPRTATCGHTFEREAIRRWCEVTTRCPICNSIVTSESLRQEGILQREITTYVDNRPLLAQEQDARADDLNLHVQRLLDYRNDTFATRLQWEELVHAESIAHRVHLAELVQREEEGSTDRLVRSVALLSYEKEQLITDNGMCDLTVLVFIFTKAEFFFVRGNPVYGPILFICVFSETHRSGACIAHSQRGLRGTPTTRRNVTSQRQRGGSDIVW